MNSLDTVRNSRMTAVLLTVALFFAAITSLSAAPAAAGAITRKILFTDGWEFQLLSTNSTTTPGTWQAVTLPHDWSIAGKIDPSNPMGNDGGYFPDGKGIYRRSFTLTPDMEGKLISLYFEGSYMATEVRVNGKLAGSHRYGYTSFSVDITPYLDKGQNSIEVTVDNSMQKNCRWYSGSGIYRQLWLMVTDKVHFEQWGTSITTSDVSPSNANITVATTITNSSTTDRNLSINVKVGNEIRSNAVIKDITIKAGATQEFSYDLSMLRPSLWSPDTPFMYTAELSISEGGRVIDSITEEFGIRKIEYDAKRGFLINDKAIIIYGGCVHHDNGILGAAAFPAAEQRRVRALKEAGFNAVRTSHNPPSEAFLRACDHMGLMVIDEAFDGWRSAKNDNDYSTIFDQDWADDLDRMILRDRNHPSIICWSIGNEVIERKELQFYKSTRMMTEHCRNLDPTRPVTQALASWDNDWDIFDPIADLHEIVGYNYMIRKAESDHERDPKRVIWQTESYPRHAFRNWTMVHDHPYIIGDFVWTALDYLGESSIGRWYYEGENPGEHYQGLQYPWHGAYCGDIDLTFWRKPISHYRQILFAPEYAETIAMGVKEPDGYTGKIKLTGWSVWPSWDSWTWEGWEGKPIEVEVYTRKPFVKFYKDGKLIGEKAVTRESEYKAVFTLDYTPGTITAEACDADGNVMGRTSLSTAGKPVSIRLTADRNSISADGQDLSFVTVELVDAKGKVCPNAEIELSFSVSGAGSLAAAGNANLKIDDSYVDSVHPTWKGRAMAVVRSGGKAGTATLSVSGPGLKSGTVKINVK